MDKQITLLIANRGEIAGRIIRSAGKLGFETVAVYSDADSDSAVNTMADKAIRIGPHSPAESYLSVERVMEACKTSGANYLHPGYGFLSENPDLAEACEKAGIVFVGPRSETIRLMADKNRAREFAAKSGLKTLPGVLSADGKILSADISADMFPVILKPVAGGGGKGMKILRNKDELPSALEEVSRQAAKNFLNPGVLIEKFLEKPRHVEVQVLCDTHGNSFIFGDRDCTLQRRYQKIIEEAPAPGISTAAREELYENVRALLSEIGYVSAGTLEFLYDGGQFYFMEMNTRIQVEHPVTEEVCGEDLVGLQLRVACGEVLSGLQTEPRGHSIEARVYSEIPTQRFLPETGKIGDIIFPDNCRVDCVLRADDSVTPYFDPMIAKLIVRGDTRSEAITKLRQALAESEITGLRSNLDFLSYLTSLPEFIEVNHSIGLVDGINTEDFEKYGDIPAICFAGAVSLLGKTETFCDPWTNLRGWRIDGARKLVRKYLSDSGTTHIVRATVKGDELEIDADGNLYQFTIFSEGTEIVLQKDDARYIVKDMTQSDKRQTLTVNGIRFSFSFTGSSSAGENLDSSSPVTHAPTSGRVVKILLAPGESVSSGDTVAILESMKMEFSLSANFDGTIKEIFVNSGELLSEGDSVFEITPK